MQGKRQNCALIINHTYNGDKHCVAVAASIALP